MRPVVRGEDPGGYADHRFAYPKLVDRLGRYCSYCEAPLKNGQVEHVLPQDLHPHLSMRWSNFLLACGNCNATKEVWPRDRDEAFWPDQDNTARAYEYPTHRTPWVNAQLNTADSSRAEALLVHTGVDRHPGHPRWSEKDDRWDMRNEVWDKALECREDLHKANTLIHRKRIAELAEKSGFWSVWRAVFAEDIDMLRRLNSAFVGTAADAFDAETLRPIPRAGGRL